MNPQDTASFSTPCRCLPQGGLPSRGAPSTQGPWTVAGWGLISQTLLLAHGKRGLFNKSLIGVPGLVLFGWPWGQPPPGFSPGASGGDALISQAWGCCSPKLRVRGRAWEERHLRKREQAGPTEHHVPCDFSELPSRRGSSLSVWGFSAHRALGTGVGPESLGSPWGHYSYILSSRRPQTWLTSKLCGAGRVRKEGARSEGRR